MVRHTLQNTSLQVLMNGILVGKLKKNKTGGLVFQYESSWLAQKGARPISLSLPLTEIPYSGDIVYNFFDNLLPDNENIRNRIQRRFKTKTNEPFDLLAKIGNDCVGAIQICAEESNKDIKLIKANPLSDKKISGILQNYQSAPLGMEEDIDEFRISLAGAQEKSAFLKYKGQWCEPIGTTATSHIFKLPIGVITQARVSINLKESCENEWLCSKITEAFGIPVAETTIREFEGVKVLIVERFDRKMSKDKSWLMRLPQEDFCQALGYSSNQKYQYHGGPSIADIMNFLLYSANASYDRDIFFKSQILFYLLAATDGHAKNFSIFIEAGGNYRLTPLYDILSVYPLIKKGEIQKQKIKMSMALKGKSNHYKWDEIQYRYFIQTAKTAGYPTERAEELIAYMTSKVDSVIEQVSQKLPEEFPQKISQPIFKGLKDTAKKLASA